MREVTTPLSDERREMAGRYVRAAWAVAGRWADRFPVYRDEFFSESHNALVRSARTFDPQKSRDGFLPHLRLACGLAMRDVLRRDRGRRGDRPVPRRLGLGESLIPGAFTGFAEVDSEDNIERILAEVPSDGRRDAVRLWAHGWTTPEIAEVHGVTMQTAWRWVREGIEFAREAMARRTA